VGRNWDELQYEHGEGAIERINQAAGPAADVEHRVIVRKATKSN
jgi:hypothetical protein